MLKARPPLRLAKHLEYCGLLHGLKRTPPVQPGDVRRQRALKRLFRLGGHNLPRQQPPVEAGLGHDLAGVHALKVPVLVQHWLQELEEHPHRARVARLDGGQAPLCALIAAAVWAWVSGGLSSPPIQTHDLSSSSSLWLLAVSATGVAVCMRVLCVAGRGGGLGVWKETGYHGDGER